MRRIFESTLLLVFFEEGLGYVDLQKKANHLDNPNEQLY